MRPEEFLKAVQSRVEWMREHNPELLERDVMFVNDETSARIDDVFVEEFLVLDGEVVH
jgi:hypothetical protein